MCLSKNNKIQHHLKHLITLILSVITLSNTYAQNPKSYYIEEEKVFTGGLVAGANFTQVDGDNYKGFRNIGLNTGVILYARMLPKLAASIEILFCQKGAQSNDPQLTNSGSALITKQSTLLNYAEIPIMLNYFEGQKGHFGAGLSYAQLINSKEFINTNNSSITYDATLHPFKKYDINLLLGGQLHLYKGLYAGLRFQYSLLSIRDKVDLEFGSPQQYNHLFALRVMYLFF